MSYLQAVLNRLPSRAAFAVTRPLVRPADVMRLPPGLIENPPDDDGTLPAPSELTEPTTRTVDPSPQVPPATAQPMGAQPARSGPPAADAGVRAADVRSTVGPAVVAGTPGQVPSTGDRSAVSQGRSTPTPVIREVRTERVEHAVVQEVSIAPPPGPLPGQVIQPLIREIHLPATPVTPPPRRVAPSPPPGAARRRPPAEPDRPLVQVKIGRLVVRTDPPLTPSKPPSGTPAAPGPSGADASLAAYLAARTAPPP